MLPSSYIISVWLCRIGRETRNGITRVHIVEGRVGINLVCHGAGRADWTTFEPPMMPKLLHEPLVLTIAKRMGKSPAQIILRWNAQQGIPTQPRSMSPAHMHENLNVFTWSLSDNDMHALSNMPQVSPTALNRAPNSTVLKLSCVGPSATSREVHHS